MEKKQKIVDIWVALDGSEHFSAFKCEEHERKLNEARGLTEQQERNNAAILENQKRVQAVKERWAAHPEEREAFLEEARRKHLETIELGKRLGWWEGASPNGDPLAPAIVVKISDLETHETTMAHVIARQGFFKSVSEARKNGWDKPVTTGDFWFRKKTACLRIVE